MEIVVVDDEGSGESAADEVVETVEDLAETVEDLAEVIEEIIETPPEAPIVIVETPLPPPEPEFNIDNITPEQAAALVAKAGLIAPVVDDDIIDEPPEEHNEPEIDEPPQAGGWLHKRRF
jgi:hypothetical protein